MWTFASTVDLLSYSSGAQLASILVVESVQSHRLFCRRSAILHIHILF